MLAQSPAPPSRCPTTDCLVELLDERTGSESLRQHTAECPMCSVTWARIRSGHSALAALSLQAPQPATLERLARAVLPEVERDLRASRGGAALRLVLPLLLLLLLGAAGLMLLGPH